MHRRDIRPEAPGERLAVLVEQVVARAGGGRQAIGEGEHPLRRAPDHARDRRGTGRRGVEEVGVDDRIILVGRAQTRQQLGGDPGGHGEHHRLVRCHRLAPVGEVERHNAALVALDRAQPPAEADGGAARLQPSERRLDEGRGERRIGDQGQAGGATLGQRLAHHRAGERRRPVRRRSVERGHEEIGEKPVPQRALSSEHVADGLIRRGLEQAGKRQIVGRPGPRHAAPLRQNPPGQRPGIEAQFPAAPIAHVRIGETRLAGPHEAIARADHGEEIADRVIARQHEMIAVVDHHAELRVAIGAAAAARLPRGVAQRDGEAGLGQRDGGGEPGQPRADDVRQPHRPSLSRISVQASASRLWRTRWRGGAQPAFSMRRSSSE